MLEMILFSNPGGKRRRPRRRRNARPHGRFRRASRALQALYIERKHQTTTRRAAVARMRLTGRLRRTSIRVRGKGGGGRIYVPALHRRFKRRMSGMRLARRRNAHPKYGRTRPKYGSRWLLSKAPRYRPKTGIEPRVAGLWGGRGPHGRFRRRTSRGLLMRRRNPFTTLRAIKEANKRAGHHFFEPETLRFFRSRILRGVIGGRFFITSEQFEDGRGYRAARKYTVRMAHDDGRIQTVDKFQAFTSAARARRAAQSLVASMKPNPPKRRSRGRRR